MRTASMEALRDLIEQETGDREKDVDESRTIIGAEKKIRQDHHSAFDQQFKKHLEVQFEDSGAADHQARARARSATA